MNAELQSFKEFLARETGQLELADLALALVVSIALSSVLGASYVRIAKTIGNRSRFAATLMPLAATTALIIAIVKSSLALSLGLVGALSIVRFRTAIKEPEELVYLFLAIAIGLGTGANHHLETFVAFTVILLALIVRSRFAPATSAKMWLSVRVEGAERPGIDALVDAVTSLASGASLHRVESGGTSLDALFSVELSGTDKLGELTTKLQELAPAAEIAFVDTADLPT